MKTEPIIKLLCSYVLSGNKGSKLPVCSCHSYVEENVNTIPNLHKHNKLKWINSVFIELKKMTH